MMTERFFFDPILLPQVTTGPPSRLSLQTPYSILQNPKKVLLWFSSFLRSPEATMNPNISPHSMLDIWYSMLGAWSRRQYISPGDRDNLPHITNLSEVLRDRCSIVRLFRWISRGAKWYKNTKLITCLPDPYPHYSRTINHQFLNIPNILPVDDSEVRAGMFC